MKLLIVRVRAVLQAVSAARIATAEAVVLFLVPREAVLAPVRITARRRRSPR